MVRKSFNDIEQRTTRYWNDDGLPELLMGTLWTVWGGLWLIGTALPKSMAFVCFWLIVPPVLACSGLFAQRALQRLKERITYPRAGYARIKRPPQWVRLTVLVVLMMAMSAVIYTGFWKNIESTAPPLVVAALALAFLVMALHSRNGRLLILSLIAAGLGIWIWRSQAGWMGLNWTFLWLGLVALLLGGLRLRRFLRENPKVAEREA
jgi:hypothetical protein